MSVNYDLSLTAQLTSLGKKMTHEEMLELTRKLQLAFLQIVVNDYALIPSAQISMSRSQDHG